MRPDGLQALLELAVAHIEQPGGGNIADAAMRALAHACSPSSGLALRLAAVPGAVVALAKLLSDPRSRTRQAALACVVQLAGDAAKEGQTPADLTPLVPPLVALLANEGETNQMQIGAAVCSLGTLEGYGIHLMTSGALGVLHELALSASQGVQLVCQQALDACTRCLTPTSRRVYVSRAVTVRGKAIHRRRSRLASNLASSQCGDGYETGRPGHD